MTLQTQPIAGGTPVVITSALIASVKAGLALDLVDNTRDADKPASSATLTAINAAISQLLGGAPPAALNTLKELADAINDDASFAASVTQLLAGKQPLLVAGANVKTVNGQSLLGAGNLNVAGGSGGSAGPIQINGSSVFDLSVPDPGKIMNLDAPRQVVTSNTVLTVAPGKVEGGYCEGVFEFDGTHTLDIGTNFNNASGFTPASTAAGARVWLAALVKDGDVLIFGSDLKPLVAAPGQVTGLTAGTSTQSTIPLTWAAPASGGTPADYLIEYRVTGTTPWSAFDTQSTNLAASVGGLAAGTGYDLRCTAENASGAAGAPSAVITKSTAVAAPMLSVPVETSPTGTVDLTDAGTLDWVKEVGNSNFARKAGANLLQVSKNPSGNFDGGPYADYPVTFSWEDGAAGNAAGSSNARSYISVDGQDRPAPVITDPGLLVVAPADTTQRRLIIWLKDEGGRAGRLVLSLSDGSVADAVYTTQAGGAHRLEVVYRAAAAGSTLKALFVPGQYSPAIDFAAAALTLA